MSNTVKRNQEIERKFLVNDTGFLDKATQSYEIRQGYICLAPEKTVRIRLRNNEAFITIKGKAAANSLSHFEWEKEIDPEDAMLLLQLCEDAMVRKTRYLIPNGAHTFEVDVFHDENEGLIVAEIELNDENDSFERPDWLGKEVTKEKRYFNVQLAGNPYQRWNK